MSQEDESQISQFSITSNPSSPIYQELPLNKKSKFDDTSSTPFNSLRKQKKSEDIQGMEERSRKRLYLLEKVVNNEDDEVDLFFKSIAFKVKKMKPHLITKTQSRVLTVTSQIEEEALTTQAITYSYPPQTNTQAFPIQANTYSFPHQTNTYSFPSETITQSFSTHLNIQSPSTTWPQNTSKKQYLSEHTTQLTQPSQESFPENLE